MESGSDHGNGIEATESSILGHKVRIVEIPERVDLIVDDVKWDFMESDGGFTLRRDAYSGPFNTLEEAVESFFKSRLPEEDAEAGE